MIPKKIHYCWFGGKPLSEMAERCIESWKKYCPDYEIIRWDESNFDLSSYDYTQEAFEAKKWAFITDVVRLHALVQQGGIYMDTDVELIAPLDSILEYDAVSGFESETDIPTGLMASVPNQELMKELLDEYEGLHFIKSDGSQDNTTNVIRITNTCLKYGLTRDNTKQTVKGMTLLPKDYLCPKNSKTGEIELTDNTIAIHHFDGSWLSEGEKRMKAAREKAPDWIPITLVNYFTRFYYVLKYDGLSALREYMASRRERF